MTLFIMGALTGLFIAAIWHLAALELINREIQEAKDKAIWEAERPELGNPQFFSTRKTPHQSHLTITTDHDTDNRPTRSPQPR